VSDATPVFGQPFSYYTMTRDERYKIDILDTIKVEAAKNEIARHNKKVKELNNQKYDD